MMRLAAAVLVALTAVQAGAQTLPRAVFDYDEKAPLDVRDDGQAQHRGDVTIRDLSFLSAGGAKRIKAYLVVPRAAPSCSAALFVHWLGAPATTNRTEFLDDAVALAENGGTMSLLVDAMWSEPHWFSVRTTEIDFSMSLQQVRDLRRALDVLLAQPGVDPARLAFVGHDFGGMYGSILAGVDGRPQLYVLMAVTTKLSDWYLLGKQPKSVKDFVAQMAPIEPTQYLPGVKARAWLFQFARIDKYVTHEHALEYFAAAPGDKAIQTYDAGHDLDVPKAHADRVRWLRERLAK